MRKLILSLVFVLATGVNFMNATNIENKNLNIEINGYCWENADTIVRLSTMINAYEGNILTHEAKYNLWVSQYEACIENGGGNDVILLEGN